MEYSNYTRERAAKDLLALSHRLSSEAFIFQTISLNLKQQAIETLRSIIAGLVLIGYSLESSTLTSLSSALSTLSADTEDKFLPFSVAIKTAQLLLTAVEALSLSSSPFPVPNSNIPPELLHLIYTFVIHQAPLLDNPPQKEKGVRAANAFEIREKTIQSLALTSKHWHQIVTQRPVVYLNSMAKLQRYAKMYSSWRESDNLRWKKGWEEIHIDLSKEGWGPPLDTDTEHLIKLLAKLLRPEKEGKHQGRLLVTFPFLQDMLLFGDPRSLVNVLANFGIKWKRSTMRIPHIERYFHADLGRLLSEYRVGDGEEQDYFINYLDQNQGTSTFCMQTLMDCRNRGMPPPRQALPPCPIFTNLTTFSALHYTSTVPQFLLQTVPPSRRPATLPPSRLRHLELSIEVDPRDPARAIQEIQSFFSTIAPRIERLAFRLRTTAPHPSPTAELNFTEHLVSSLLSCRRLQHLEIGGFGFSPELLTLLSQLQLTSLFIRPLQHVMSSKHVMKVLHSPLRQSLVTLWTYEPVRPDPVKSRSSSQPSVRLAFGPNQLHRQPATNVSSTSSSPSSLELLVAKAKELGIKLKLVEMMDEWSRTSKMLLDAGLDRSAI
ncbi:hypothetical protein JCM3765_005455 [Sporobolomyces pararoseus]